MFKHVKPRKNQHPSITALYMCNNVVIFRLGALKFMTKE